LVNNRPRDLAQHAEDADYGTADATTLDGITGRTLDPDDHPHPRAEEVEALYRRRSPDATVG
jgi:hypothetical protein